jgi:hypothetical protein
MATRTELTIASGEITVTQSYHEVDTEGDGASDDLDTVNGGEAGSWIFLVPADGARTVVIKHGTGNIYCRSGADYTMDDSTDCTILIKATASVWLCIDY